MSIPSSAIAVYGASGHTGRFVVQEAQRRGLHVVAVGRSAASLAGAFDASVERRVAALDEAPALAHAFSGCAVVINCAGPFLDTARPVALAALRAGCHLVDVTAEQASAQASLADLDAPARAAGRAVIPAAGFYGGLADLLASVLAEPGTIDEITVAVGLDHWWPTAGTRITGARNQVPRVVLRDGHLVPLAPAVTVPDWVFSPPLGVHAMAELPFSEVITLAHHLPVLAVRSLISRRALDDIRDASTPPPVAVDAHGRSAQRWELAVRLRQGGTTRTAALRGSDIYAVTAPIVIEAVQRLLAPGFRGCGAMALAQAVNARAMLHALDGAALEWLPGQGTQGQATHGAAPSARPYAPPRHAVPAAR